MPLSDRQGLVGAARAFGGPAELVVYPGDGHDLDFANDWRDGDDAHHRAVEFLRVQLGSTSR